MINLASILHVLFEISRKKSKRPSDLSEIGFREFNHRRSTLAVIFDAGYFQSLIQNKSHKTFLTLF